MADKSFNTKIGVVVEVGGARLAEQKLKSIGNQIGKITDVLNTSLAKRGGFDFNRALGFEAAHAGAKATGNEIANATRKAGQFDMKMLSIMFGGMAMRRIFGGALRSLSNTFAKVEGNTSQFAQSTTKLTASWEFLKFSIFNALDQPHINNFIDFLVNAINWTSEWIGKYPALGEAIVGAFAFFTVAGAALETFASFKLFWTSFAGPDGWIVEMMGKGMGTSEAVEGTVVSKFATGMSALAAIAAGGILIWIALDYLGIGGTNDTPPDTKGFLAKLALGSIAGFVLGGWPGALAAFTIIILLEINKRSLWIAKEQLTALLGTPGPLRTPEQNYLGGGPYTGQSMLPQTIQETQHEELMAVLDRIDNGISDVSEADKRTADIMDFFQNNPQYTLPDTFTTSTHGG